MTTMFLEEKWSLPLVSCELQCLPPTNPQDTAAITMTAV